MTRTKEPTTITDRFTHEDERVLIEVSCSYEQTSHKKVTTMAMQLPDGEAAKMVMDDGASETVVSRREVVVEMLIDVRGRTKQKLILRERDFRALVKAVSKVLPPDETEAGYGIPPRPWL